MMLVTASCQSFKNAISGVKQENSDEFLVQKKNPLVLPPDFTDLPVHPFLDSFLQPTVLTFSSTALIMLDNFISSGRFVNKYPPDGPLEL